MSKWVTHTAENSLYNTPATFAIYISKLVLDYTKQVGGLVAIEKTNREKGKVLYDAIDKSRGYYKGHAKPDSRSIMKVTFRLASEQLEGKFAEESKKAGLIGLKGHRSVGGLRASLYNAVTLDGTRKLVEFMKEFQEKNP